MGASRRRIAGLHSRQVPPWRGPPLRPRPELSRTSAPGRLESSTRIPYAAEIATPSTAVSPTAPQSAAAVASRTPQPRDRHRDEHAEQDRGDQGKERPERRARPHRAGGHGVGSEESAHDQRGADQLHEERGVRIAPEGGQRAGAWSPTEREKSGQRGHPHSPDGERQARERECGDPAHHHLPRGALQDHGEGGGPHAAPMPPHARDIPMTPPGRT